jgi:hypothetical protein
MGRKVIKNKVDGQKKSGPVITENSRASGRVLGGSLVGQMLEIDSR